MIVKQNKPKSKLVEWTDENGPHRVMLPADSNEIELGAPVGYPFELVDFKPITPLTIARVLREHGIWTARDLRGNVGIARAAILQVTNDILTALLQSIREVDK